MRWSSPPPWFDQSNSICRRYTTGSSSAWPFPSPMSHPPSPVLILPAAPFSKTLSICVRDQFHTYIHTYIHTQSFLYADIVKRLAFQIANTSEFYRNKERSSSQRHTTSLLAELSRLPGVSLWFSCARRGNYARSIPTNGRNIVINDGHDLARHSWNMKHVTEWQKVARTWELPNQLQDSGKWNTDPEGSYCGAFQMFVPAQYESDIWLTASGTIRYRDFALSRRKK